MPRPKGTTTKGKATTKKATTKKTAAPVAKSNPLAMARAALKKSFGTEESRVELDPNAIKKSWPHLPTGSLVIDYLFGGALNKFGVAPCPGIPKGKILNVYGFESSGKTTLCKMAAAQTCANGGTVGFLDYEYAFDPSYAAALGVPIHDPNRFELRQPNTLEEGFKIIWAWVEAGVDLIIIDSVGAGVPAAVFARELKNIGDEERMGLVASRWSKFLPAFNGLVMRKQAAIIAVSQVRAGNFGGMGSNTTVQGGNSFKFYSTIRMKLRKVQMQTASGYDALSHKTDKQVIGIKVKAKLDKNKIAPTAHHEAEFYIRHGEGIDDVQSCIDVGIAHGIVKKSGAWISWERGGADDIKQQGMEKFRQAIMEEGGAFEALYRKVANLITVKGAERTMEEEEEVLLHDDPLAELDDLMSDVMDDSVPAPVDPDDDDNDGFDDDDE